MSRPRSGSPRYRRFPWEEPGFDPHKVVAELDGGPSDRNHRSRGDPEEHWEYFGEDMHRDAQRRSPPYPEDRPFGRQRHQNQEEFYHRRSSPNHHMMGFNDDRGLSPLRDGGGGGGNEDRRRDELFQGYENRERSSPPRLAREKLPPTPRSHSHQRESGMGWRREEQGRGRGRFRDLSPGERLDDQRVGAGRERGRRTTQGMNTDPRRGEEAHEERNPPFKRQRRETDGAAHLGYRNEEDFGGQRYSVDSPRDRFGGGAQSGLPRGEARRSGPVVIEHDHGIRDVPRWEQFRARGGHEPHFSRQRSPRPMASSSSSSPQERFRTPDSRLDEQEDGRGRQFQDNWRESGYNENRRNPAPQDRLNPVRHSSRGGPMNHRGSGGPRPGRGQLHRGQGGRTRPPRTQQRLQPSSQGYQDEEERPGYRPHREDRYKDPNDAGEPDWAEEDRLQQWEPRKTGSLDHQLQRADLNPKIPRQREWGWSDQKSDDVTVVTEETLTIKVDMSRPVNKNRYY